MSFESEWALEEDRSFAWRWSNVTIPISGRTIGPTFNYQRMQWFLVCHDIYKNFIDLCLCYHGHGGHTPSSLSFSPFSITVHVLDSQFAEIPILNKDYNTRVDNLGTFSIWAQKTSLVEKIIPEFSQNRLLTFRVEMIIEQAPRAALISAPLTFYHPMHCKTFANVSVQTGLTSDSISSLEYLSKDFSNMMNESSDFNVEVHCGDYSTKAHKDVLCSRSPVLAKMLQSDMVEAKTNGITIRDMNVDTFKPFLCYLYTGRLDDAITHDAALSLYEAGDMYWVQSLSSRCSQFLLQNLTVDNACNVLVVADRHNDEDLKKAVVQYILQEKIPKSGDNWKAFCESHSALANEVIHQYVELLTSSEPPRKKLKKSLGIDS